LAICQWRLELVSPTTAPTIRLRFCRELRLPVIFQSEPLMKRIHSALLALPLCAGLLFAALDAPAADTTPPATAELHRSGARAARAMLEEAAAYLADNPAERAFAAFNNQKGVFYRQDLYVFVLGMSDGVVHAYGGAPEGLVGANVLDMTDATGRPIFREMLALGQHQGGGALSYVWLNRVSNRVEDKTMLLRKVGDYLIGVGYYLPRSTAAQAESLLKVAIAEVRKSPQAAFAAFDDPHGPFVRDDLYVFAVGLEDARFLAMGVDPALVGTDVALMRDAAGKPVISDMIALARSQGSGVVDYVWRNPVTNRVENKHSRIERVDNLLIGVGYYTR
jgi:cytochrome c